MSKINVNQVDTQCGSTLTLGSSGKTVTLASGASQSGFGRTGTVDWCTTAKTSPLTVESGKGYFINTTGGAITVTLPASPSAGDIVAVADYANTWQTNNLTLGRNGSKINGGCFCSTLTTEGASVTMVYVDATRGWKQVNDGTLDVSGQPNYVTATGGTVLTCGNFKTHIFTADGCFSVTAAGLPSGSTTIDYVVIGGGGGGGRVISGGGGGGGMRLSNGYSVPAPTTSPLASPTAITASVQTYPITVGAGGAAGTPGCSTNGSNSIFSTITSAGGGIGTNGVPTSNGGPGASGGGASWRDSPGTGTGGTGNTPPVSPPQGNNGGTNVPTNTSGGGGGAGAVGGNGSGSTSGNGGAGSYIGDSFFGPTAPTYGTPGPVSSTRYFSGGGGGTARDSSYTRGSGGAGGGGQGGYYSPSGVTGVSGTANTGGGSGGNGLPASGAGGSGIVMIRYKFQN